MIMKNIKNIQRTVAQIEKQCFPVRFLTNLISYEQYQQYDCYIYNLKMPAQNQIIIQIYQSIKVKIFYTIFLILAVSKQENKNTVQFQKKSQYYYLYYYLSSMIQYNQNQGFETKIHDILKNFNSIIELIETTSWKKCIPKAAKIYNIKVYNLDKITLNKVKEMYTAIVQKFYIDDKNKESWHQNELRIYVWLLFTYAHYLKKSPEQFDQNQWQNLSNVFLGKSVHICQFQYQSLKKLSEKVKKWTNEEDNLLIQIFNEKQLKNKWNQIAKSFYIKSDKKWFRTPKQCRQRWNNYLDPTKSKQRWAKQEDQKLIQLVIQKGKKWALISKILVDGRRTEHMVKNRFNSLIVKYLKTKNKDISPDSVILQQLEEWVSSRIDKSEQMVTKQKIIKNEKVQNREAVKLQQIDEYQIQKPISKPTKSFEKYKQKKQDLISTPSQLYFEVKSPGFLLSPNPYQGYTPIVFSPYTDFNGSSFNLFGFQRIGER